MRVDDFNDKEIKSISMFVWAAVAIAATSASGFCG